MKLEEVKAKAAECLSEGFLDPGKFSAKLGEFIRYAFAHYESMDDEAKAYVDRAQEGIIGMIAGQIERLPDGPQRRSLVRQVALARGKHLKAEGLTRSLSAAPAYELPIIQKAEPVFFGVLQHLLDVLHDATTASHRGAAQFSAISLLFWVVDELLVAFHLAQRKYATQAYSHIRTVYDNLEKVELFYKHPEWADVWASEDEKAKLRELKPSAVRMKLGKPRFDPLYSFFSEVGTHGTFRGVQGRVAKRVKANSSDDGGIGVRVWVGGIPREDQIVMSISSCIFAVVSSLLTAVEVFHARLNEEDAARMLQTAIEQSVEFLQEHFVNWAEKNGFDVTELLYSIQKKPSFT